MTPLLASLAQALDQEPTPITGVDVAWSALAPMLTLIGGAVLLDGHPLAIELAAARANSPCKRARQVAASAASWSAV